MFKWGEFQQKTKLDESWFFPISFTLSLILSLSLSLSLSL